MNSDTVISLKNVGKKYKLYPSPKERLKELFHPFSKKYHREFWAIRDISFDVARGETVGIVGQNGSGKSTLLQIICGVLTSAEGSLTVCGRISSLLELGAGFHPDYSGRENVYMNGAIMGLNKAEMDARLPRIEAFAEIGQFIEQPVKTYSSGMFVRLAFAAAVSVDPEILVIDEALAVGDSYFQQKCITKLKEFQAEGKTILFVSHDPVAIKVLCGRALLLEEGKIVFSGKPDKVLDYYQGRVLQRLHHGSKKVLFRTEPGTEPDIFPKEETVEVPKGNAFTEGGHIGTGEVIVDGVDLLDGEDREIEFIESEQWLKIRIQARFLRDFEDPHLGFIVRNRLGMSIFGTNTYTAGRTLEPVKNNETLVVTFSFKCSLQHGDYNVSIGVANRGYGGGNFEEILFLRHGMRFFRVIRNPRSISYEGVVNLFPEIAFYKPAGQPELHR